MPRFVGEEGMRPCQRRSPIRWSSQMLWEKKSMPSPVAGVGEGSVGDGDERGVEEEVR